MELADLALKITLHFLHVDCFIPRLDHFGERWVGPCFLNKRVVPSRKNQHHGRSCVRLPISQISFMDRSVETGQQQQRCSKQAPKRRGQNTREGRRKGNGNPGPTYRFTNSPKSTAPLPSLSIAANLVAASLLSTLMSRSRSNALKSRSVTPGSNGTEVTVRS